MRKFASLCLSLVLLVALALPAWAYTDTEPPLWQKAGYASLAECLEEEMIDEAQYGVIAERSAGFNPSAYYASEYGYYEGSMTVQEYMDYWELDEEEFAQEMLTDWFYEQTYDAWLQNYQEELRQQQAEARDKAIRDAGGVPGQVNVMLDGKCLSFGKAAPEITSGRTMVPMRAILEALGAKVDYDEDTRTATVTLGETVLTHVIGEKTVTTGAGETLQMKAASYIKSGRTMVPLRFFSEALGYDVFWDDAYRTAVLIDKAALLEGVDSRFTILNGFIQKQYAAFDPNKNLESKASFTGNVTVYDTIQGNSQHKLDLTLTTLMGKDAVNISGKMDLSLIAKLLGAVDAEAVPDWVDELLGDFSFQYIAGEKDSWFHVPELVEAMRKEGYDLPKGDVWFREDTAGSLDSYYMALGLMRTQLREMTVGKLLYQAAAGSGDSAFTYYRTIEEAAKVMDLLLGDKTFTKSGSSYKWKLDQETIDKRSKEFAELLLTESIDFPATIEMTLKADGSCDFSMELVTEEDGAVTARFTLSGTASPDKGSMTAKVQIKNVCDMELKIESSVRAVDTKPDTQPPASAVIVDEDYDQMPLAV